MLDVAAFHSKFTLLPNGATTLAPEADIKLYSAKKYFGSNLSFYSCVVVAFRRQTPQRRQNEKARTGRAFHNRLPVGGGLSPTIPSVNI